ncbi:MAG: FeoA family protein [Oscillospiraceae bacterium]|nr:FeoA family protein [Oscillospiraceae bacterium]
MFQQIPLNTLREGQSGKIVKLTSEKSMRRRLQDIGLVEGTTVSCLLKSPWGDPAAYLIRGAVIALRSADASNILINTVAETAPVPVSTI